MNAIPIRICEPSGLPRRGEIVTAGVPLPRRFACRETCWAVRAPGGEVFPCQTLPLAFWLDGSIKWLAITFPATVSAHDEAKYFLTVSESADSSAPAVSVRESVDAIHIETGAACFIVPRRGTSLLGEVRIGEMNLLAEAGAQAIIADDVGRRLPLVVDTIELHEAGPIRCQLSFRGRFPKSVLRAFGRWTFSARSAMAVLEVTIHNPSRARHPKGFWDLGDQGSVFFSSFSITVPLVGAQRRQIYWREQPSAPLVEQTDGELEICQLSSGGINFSSRNHVNRHGRVPFCERGYHVRSPAGVHRGLRAQPTCMLRIGERWVAAAMREFWQRFPQAIRISSNQLHVDAFAPQADDDHELQGGEQKTSHVGLVFARSEEPKLASLAAVTDPLIASCDHASVVESGAVFRLPESQKLLHSQWHLIASHALKGSHSFFEKREIADEYGWRNYGDLWADHEQQYYAGPLPIASHYNNQYDALETFLLCYLLTGDVRWWSLADPLARHVIDIDIYHCKQDRAAYNGGLFWHTSHYCDAATSTHRCYSRSHHPVGGGGPSNEHNYTSGLLLYYYLTGNSLAREAVVGLAEWVLHMDEGRRHLLGLVLDVPTGFASRTRDAGYHGPGRGAGNSLNALLDGWLLTARREFLDKAAELILRTIHPRDNLASLDLGNAESRWSYTVFLQSLVRLLSIADECPLPSDLAAYARASLLHYARWMAAHETFYLDRPEQLEFPTETWAAQEIRKANVLAAAALHAAPQEAVVFQRRAAEFYDRAWSCLMSFPTRHQTRPVILALQLGLAAACLAEMQPTQEPNLCDERSFSTPPRNRFVPQREAVRRRLHSPAHVLAMVVRLMRVWRWREVWQTSWPAQRMRRKLAELIGSVEFARCFLYQRAGARATPSLSSARSSTA